MNNDSDEQCLDPLVKGVRLDLPPPTLEDNIPDTKRVWRGLREEVGRHQFDIPLYCLQCLSDTLRENNWNVAVTVYRDNLLGVGPSTAGPNYGLAVDMGTTTVAAQLVDLDSGEVVGVEESRNLQAAYGEDVISSVIYACGKEGVEPVRKAVLKNINQLIRRLADRNSVAPEKINVIVVAGNTTMSHLLLGLTPCAIRLEPYVPTTTVYPAALAADVGIRINPGGVLETIPGVASYVGGDIVAGVMSCGIAERGEVRCLIDIGTNGEIAVGNQDWLVCCSPSIGLSFEEGGTRCGIRAIGGAIEKLNISNGRLKYETIGNAKPRGICGSGLIDCICELVRNGIIGADGKFHRNLGDRRLSVKDDIPQYTIAGPDETETGETIFIAEPDIDNLIKSKGAIFSAIKSLMDYIGLGFDEIERFYVAGGFGSCLNISKAIAIGLLPDIPQEKIEFIGNSSLAGARMCLLYEKAFEKCLNISQSMTNMELSNHQAFKDEYMAALFLPHTDRGLFPSVRY